MFRSISSSALALIVGAAPVLADVTPSQVWDNLAKYYSDMGYEVTVGNTDDAGETLTLSDVSFTNDSDALGVALSIPKMVMQQTGDAKVRTVIDGDVALKTEPKQQDDEAAPRLNILLSMPGNEMLSSGTPEDMLHELTYPTLSAQMSFPEADETPGEAPFVMAATDVKANYRSTQGEATESTYDLTAAGVDLTVSVTEPAEEGVTRGGSFNAKARVDGVTSSGTMTMPKGDFSTADRLDLALNAGMKADGKFALGPINGSFEFAGTDEGGAAQSGSGTYTADNSELSFGMSRDALSYQGSAGSAKAEMTLSSIPFPISYAFTNASGGLSFPVSKSENAQTFKFNYALAGLTLADGIWNLIDPNNQLPRDPANLTLDLEGDAMVNMDLFDPAFSQEMTQAEEMPPADDTTGEAAPETPDTQAPETAASPEVPLIPKTVKINQFTLEAVGAKADLTGDLVIPEGAQQPVGIVEGSFDGVNALLDKLVAIGLVPQEQVMGARMMIAMFAKPVGDNPDQLQTKLEFKENGTIFANGQQVK